MKTLLFGALIALATVSSDAMATTSSNNSGDDLSSEQAEPSSGERELNLGRKTDAGVASVFQIQENGIHWYEAEDHSGNRYVVTNVVGGIASGKGVVDFGDGAGGRFVSWQGTM